jgi:hypothetical protein
MWRWSYSHTCARVQNRLNLPPIRLPSHYISHFQVSRESDEHHELFCTIVLTTGYLAREILEGRYCRDCSTFGSIDLKLFVCVGLKLKARGCGISKISPPRTRQFLCPYEIHMCCTNQAISGLLQKQYLCSHAVVPQTLAEHTCTIFEEIWTFSWMMYKYNVVHITLGSLELY